MAGLIGTIKCGYYTWQLGKTVTKCDSELRANCGPKASIEQCITYLDSKGASSLSQAKLQCIKDNNPKVLTKTLESCGKSSIKWAFGK